jgi:hypothetical protein
VEQPARLERSALVLDLRRSLFGVSRDARAQEVQAAIGSDVPTSQCAADEPRNHDHRVAGHGTEELLHLRRRRLERGELGRELVDRSDPSVASLVVLGHRLVVRPGPGEELVHRVGAQLGVGERVGDAPGGDRVAAVAGVAGQRPAGPYGVRKKFGTPPPAKQVSRCAACTRSAGAASPTRCRHGPHAVKSPTLVHGWTRDCSAADVARPRAGRDDSQVAADTATVEATADAPFAGESSRVDP